MFNKSKKREEKPETRTTFTKIWVDRTLKLSWICIFLSFLLAFLGKMETAQTLSCAIVVNIVSVFSGYFFKSYFETKEEKKIELKEKYLSNGTQTQDESTESISDENSCG